MTSIFKILILVWEGMDQYVVVMLESKIYTDIFAIVILLPFQKSRDTIIVAVHYCDIAMILNYCKALSNRKSQRGIYLLK